MTHKMYFFVRKDLGMSAGKVAGQVAHAAEMIARHITTKLYDKYIADGQYKLVYKVKTGDEEPFDLLDDERITPHDIFEHYGNEPPNGDIYQDYFVAVFVHDRKLDQVTVFGVLTDDDVNEEVNGKRTFRLYS